MNHKTIERTTSPVEPGNFRGVLPEFGRCADVQRMFGLRRGTLYNLHKQGKIKGVLLRVAGQKSGVRLWHLQSIRDLINCQMAEQEASANIPLTKRVNKIERAKE
jgi:hypothetical protein